MTQGEIERYRTLARLRVVQIADEDLAIRRWLGFVRFFGWPLFVAGILCPLVAGTVGIVNLFGGKQSLPIVILSFTGAAAVALHKNLECEKYQAALRRTSQSLRGLSEAYEAVSILPDSTILKQFESAEHRLRELRASSSDLPPKRRRSFQEEWQDIEQASRA